MKNILSIFVLLAFSTAAFAQTNLLTNGDFEAATSGNWFVNFGGGTVPTQSAGGNTFFFADIQSTGAAASDVNLSQVVPITQGADYLLTFEASTDATTGSRTIVAGIGLNISPWSAATETITITSTTQTYTVPLTASGFGGADSRVLFDLAGALGIVVIDNVTLVAAPAAAPTVVENFDAATSVDGWTQAANATTSPSEVTFNHDATAGVGGSGAMRWGGTNSEAVGKAYIVEKVFGGQDFGGATDVTVSVSVKSEGLTAANVSMLTEVGPGNTQNKASINADINDSGFSTLTFEHTAVDGAANFVKLQVVVSPGANIGDGGTVLIDDLTFTASGSGGGGGGMVVPPTTAAPTPPARNAEDVFSIYSDAYTNFAVNNIDAGWCGGAAVTPIQIGSDNVWQKNPGIDCHGIDFSGNKQDLSAFTHIHFDFYTNDTDLTGDVFNVKLVDFGGGSAEASALEVNINGGSTPALVADAWVSVDVDITALVAPVANSLTRSDVAQIGITTANVTNVWYDNIYLYKDPATSNEITEIPEGFKLDQNYPNPFNPTTNISYSIPAAADVTLEVYNLQGQKVMTLVDGFQSAGAHNATLDASNLASGVYMYKLVSGNNIQVKKMMLIK